MNVHWGMLVVIYLFLAGMSGGLYFASAMYEFFNGRSQQTSRRGYRLSFVLLIVAVLFLIYDLERPARFVHMMLAYKFFSPMSMGSWGLLLFGINLFVTLTANCDGPMKPLGDFFTKILPYKMILLIGCALSVFLAAYTGVLLGETTVTLWSVTPFLGAIFLASGMSCGVCVLTLMSRGDEEFVSKGKIFDNLCLVVEIALCVFFVLALTIGYGPYPEAGKLFSGLYGFLFFGVGIVLGAIVPIFINISGMKGVLSPSLVLVGAFMLRYAIVFAGQQ